MDRYTDRDCVGPWQSDQNNFDPGAEQREALVSQKQMIAAFFA